MSVFLVFIQSVFCFSPSRTQKLFKNFLYQNRISILCSLIQGTKASCLKSQNWSATLTFYLPIRSFLMFCHLSYACFLHFSMKRASSMSVLNTNSSDKLNVSQKNRTKFSLIYIVDRKVEIQLYLTNDNREFHRVGDALLREGVLIIGWIRFIYFML